MNKKWSKKNIFLQNQMFYLMYFIFFIFFFFFSKRKNSKWSLIRSRRIVRTKRWPLWILIWFGCLLAHTRSYIREITYSYEFHSGIWVDCRLLFAHYFLVLDFRLCNLDRHNDNSIGRCLPCLIMIVWLYWTVWCLETVMATAAAACANS